MDNVTDPVTVARAALAVLEQELVAAGARAKVAAEELGKAARGADCNANLPELRRAREQARADVAAEEKRVEEARRALARAEAEQRAADERAQREQAAAEARAAEEQAARELAARLEQPLATLAAARTALDDATAQIGDSLTDPAVAAARVRAMVFADELVTAIDAVANIEPRHPELAPARAQVKAAEVHGVLSDLAPALADAAAARALLASAHAKIIGAAGAHPGRDVLRLAMLLAAIDTARSPSLPREVIGLADEWLGLTVGQMEAARGAVGLFGAPPVSNISPSELAAYVLSGRAHEAALTSQERTRAAHLRALADATAGHARGTLGSHRAACAEIEHGRRTGDWIAADREQELRALIAAGVRFVVDQVRAQIGPRCPLGPFKVASAPGSSAIVDVPQCRPWIVNPVTQIGTYEHPVSAREQVIRFLGLVGPLADFAALVPNLDAEAARVAA